MKHYYLIVIALFTFGGIKAQQTPSTIGVVYDFEIGDSLQYYFSYYQIGNGQGHRGNNIIIITGKTVSADTTYYTYTNDINFTWFSPPVIPTIKPAPFKWLDYTHTIAPVTDEDSSVFTLHTDLCFCDPQPAPCFDSVYMDSLYNSRKQTWHSNNGLSTFSAKFAEGLGLVDYYLFNESFGSTDTYELIYYRKANGETWGNYELMVGVNEPKKTIQLHVFPNPANNTLYLTSEDATNKKLTIYASDGKAVGPKSNMTNTAELDISGLSPAIYFVEVQSKEGIGRYKFVKE